MTNITKNNALDLNNNNVWWVVEYMDGSVKQTLIFAATKKEAGAGFKQIIRVVKYQ